MTAALTLLHTAASHVRGFDALLARMAPSVSARHAVRADLLSLARQPGVERRSLGAAVAAAVREAAGEGGTRVVLCTCSTIGGHAERAGGDAGLRVLRVDRPMAERAVRGGRRVLVLATLASTLEPTLELLREAAAAAGTGNDLQAHLCEGAWALFEAGRRQDYLRNIAGRITGLGSHAEVVVLAQASMAPAAELCGTTPPVLSSPRSGLAAALALAGHATPPPG